MSTTTNVTAYLCAGGAADAIDFYKRAFGAVEKYRMTGDDGRIGHAELTIGETDLYLSDEWPQMGVLSPKTLKGNGVSFVLAVPDVEASWQRAIDAGATVERELADQPHGRGGWLVDPFGHRWSIMSPNPAFDPHDVKSSAEGEWTTT
jgi:PhnB protein